MHMDTGSLTITIGTGGADNKKGGSMLPSALLQLPIELLEDLDVSDVCNLTDAAASTLAGLPPDIRPMVEDELARLFGHVIAIAYYCGIGRSDLLGDAVVTMQLKALIACEVEGEVPVKLVSAQYWLDRRWADSRIWVTGIKIIQ
jgi:hypothetical protein